MIRHRLSRYALFLGALSLPSILLGLLTVEVALRFIPVKRLGFADKLPWARFHPGLLFDLNHEQRETQVVAGVGIWRPDVDRPKRRFRILILGDSYSAGDQDSACWPSYMRKILERAGLNERIEIVNTAISGYSAWQEKTMLEILLPTLKPDLVIGTWVPNDATPEFMYVGDGLTLPYPWSYRELHSGSCAGRLKTLFIRHSLLYQLWLQRFARRFSRPDVPPVVGWKDLINDPLPPPSDPILRHHLGLLREMRDLAVHCGAVFRRVYFGLMLQNYEFVFKNVLERSQAAGWPFVSGFGHQKYLMTALDEPEALNINASLGEQVHPSLIWFDYGHFAPRGALQVAALTLNSILPDMPVTLEERMRIETETASVREVDRKMNRILCQGKFAAAPGLEVYRTPGLLGEPLTLRVNDGARIVVACRPGGNERFRPGAEYYFKIDGFAEGAWPDLHVIHDGEDSTGEPGRFYEDSARKLVARTWVFRLSKESSEVRIELAPKAGERLYVRSWALSGGAYLAYGVK